MNPIHQQQSVLAFLKRGGKRTVYSNIHGDHVIINRMEIPIHGATPGQIITKNDVEGGFEFHDDHDIWQPIQLGLVGVYPERTRFTLTLKPGNREDKPRTETYPVPEGYVFEGEEKQGEPEPALGITDTSPTDQGKEADIPDHVIEFCHSYYGMGGPEYEEINDVWNAAIAWHKSTTPEQEKGGELCLSKRQTAEMKYYLQRRARDYGGIGYEQIDQFIDDFNTDHQHFNQ